MNSYIVTPVGPDIPPDHFLACIESVQKIPERIVHVLVFDGGGTCSALRLPSNAIRVDLPQNVRDIGSTPRTIGAAYAWGLGADSVSFLDADCLVREDHIEKAIAHQKKTEKPVICSGREILSWDGALRGSCPEMNPASNRFFDTNTFTFFREAIGLSYCYGTLTGYEQHKIGDRILSEKAAIAISCHYHPTVTYRTCHQFHYKHFSWPIPDGMKIKNLSTDENTR